MSGHEGPIDMDSIGYGESAQFFIDLTTLVQLVYERKGDAAEGHHILKNS